MKGKEENGTESLKKTLILFGLDDGRTRKREVNYYPDQIKKRNNFLSLLCDNFFRSLNNTLVFSCATIGVQERIADFLITFTLVKLLFQIFFSF